MMAQDQLQDFFYPEEDGGRSCAGCGAIPGRGHVPIGHAPIIPCPVGTLEQLLADTYGSATQHHWRRMASNNMGRLHEAQREVERLRGLLAQLEWASDDYDLISSEDRAICPVCGQLKEAGRHLADCWLAREIRP